MSRKKSPEAKVVAARLASDLALGWFCEVDAAGADSLCELLDDGDLRFSPVEVLAVPLKAALLSLPGSIVNIVPSGAAVALMAFADEFSGEDGEGQDYEPCLASLAKASGMTVGHCRIVLDRMIRDRVISVCIWAEGPGGYLPGPEVPAIPLGWLDGQRFTVGVGDAGLWAFGR